jgi:hypothetical protein
MNATVELTNLPALQQLQASVVAPLVKTTTLPSSDPVMMPSFSWFRVSSQVMSHHFSGFFAFRLAHERAYVLTTDPEVPLIDMPTARALWKECGAWRDNSIATLVRVT